MWVCLYTIHHILLFFMIFCSSELIKNSWNTWFIAVSSVLTSFSNFWCESISRERGKFSDHKTIFQQRQYYMFMTDKLFIIIILFDRHRNNIVWIRNTCWSIFIWPGRVTNYEMCRWQQPNSPENSNWKRRNKKKTSNSVTQFP